MTKDLEESLKNLKDDYLRMERVYQDERESLVKLVNTLGTALTAHGELRDEFQAVKEIVSTDDPLPIDQLEGAINNLKDSILAYENIKKGDDDAADPMAELRKILIDSCRILKIIINEILEDFYPVPKELKEKADSIEINCYEEIKGEQLKETSDKFMSYIGGLRSRIQGDFRYVNKTFIQLLKQVKELESAFSEEFGKDDHIKEIEYFEMKINEETITILDSFNIHTTINEIKSTVLGKLENIKKIVSIRKEEEVKKFQSAQENISVLKKRIKDAEKDASIMSRKARQLQTVAMQDGLTGLYNRKAFDTKLDSSLKSFRENEESFSLILFDLNDFKKINDTFGHVAGDKVLIKVAECLKETFRRDDFITRYGGDEFAVIVEGLDKEMADERLKVFNENLKKRRFVSYKKGEIDITVSAGFTSVQDNDSPESIIERADTFMYLEKEKKNKKA